MRRLLPLALVCLVAAQAVSAGRSLQATPRAASPTWRKQYVQFTVSIQGRTCAELPTIPPNNLAFNLAYRAAIRQDVARYITSLASVGGYNATAIVATIGTPGTDCTDWSYNGVNYAGLRAAASFNGTNTTLIRDFLWDSTREGICKGGYRQDVWVSVATLMATNGLTVRLNNGSRQNPFGANMGWVPVPVLPCPKPPPAVPSPSPALPPASPSPAPASPCATIPNGVVQADGTCKCTNPAFAIEGKDGNTLVQCISSSATVCPAPTSTAVKDNSTPVPKLLGCVTPSTDCPAPYTFPLYGGSPSAKKECRLPVVDCTYTPFTLKVTNANGVLIGCVDPSSNACPFVAFRTAPAYALDSCQKVDSCPIYSSTVLANSTQYTTSARAADRTLTACLTLAPDNKCPANIPGVNYPVEVVLGDPTSCGGSPAGQTCIFGGPSNPFSNTRVEECLATGAACDPARFPLQLFKFEGAGATKPTLVGCRQARPFPGTCDFTAAAMGTTSKDPNADSYTIEVYQTQANLVGCIVTGSTTCPADYPVAKKDAAGNLQSCAPSNNAVNPCISNSAEPVPLKYANGTWMGVCVARTQSCLTSYASTPVTIRNANGDMIECREQINTCPTTAVLDTDGTTAVFSTFPMFKPNSDGTPVITSCYPPAAVGSTCTISIDGANYTTPIKSSTAGAALQGCLASSATKCPAEFPFTILNGTTVVSCAPAGDLTACTSPYIPATTSGVLVGCIIPVAGACPAIYPTTIATGINQPALECMTANSVCYKPTQPFWLFEEKTATDGSKYLEVTWCINPQQSITNCDQANPAIQPNPVGAAWQNAAEVYNNAGTSIIGCIKRPTPAVATSLTTCPPEVPFIFKDVNGGTFQCRAGISPATTCAGAVAGATAPPGIGDYTVNVIDSAGNTVGCTVSGGSTCPPNGVLVSETSSSATEKCLTANLTSCTGVTNAAGAARSFPIYSGTNADGSPRLVRCIAPVVGTDCTSTAVNTAGANYNVPVYSTDSGTGQVIGCVRQSSEAATPCPASAPFYLLTAGATSSLVACIQDRPACNITTTAWTAYTVPLTTANATKLLGCMAAPATECPTAVPTPYTIPFVIRNADGSVRACQQQSLNAVTSCAGFSPAGMLPIVNSTVPGATAPVVGCQIVGAGGVGVFPNACANGYVAIYAQDLTLVSCQPPNTPCGGRYEVENTNAAGDVVYSCWDFDGLAKKRRSLLAGNVPGSVSNGCVVAGWLAMWNGNTLKQCRNVVGLTITACANNTGGLILNGAYAAYTTELWYKASNTSTLEGCLVNTATTCPNYLANTAWPYYIATANGTLVACAEVASCPSGTIPVYGTADASLTSPLVGCVDPASTNTTSPCPTWGGTAYTFFKTDSQGIVVACYLDNVNSTCPSNYINLVIPSVAVEGCYPANTSCPTFAINGNVYQWEFYSSTSASDATPVLSDCVSAVNITNNCAGTGHTVPLLNRALTVDLTSTAALAADGCMVAGPAAGARCPSTHPYPLIDSGAIIACFSSIDSSSCIPDYPTYSVPLCRSSVQTARTTNNCPAANTTGCIRNVDVTADSDGDTVGEAPSGNTTLISQVLASCYPTPARGYPTVDGYALWVANINDNGATDAGELEFLFGCFKTSGAGPITICDRGCTIGNDGCYAVEVTINTALQGCTDESATQCEQFKSYAQQPSWTCTNQGTP